ISEGRAMVNAARKYNRLMLAGTQQRSGDHFISAKQYIDSGKLGKICMCRAWILSHKNPLEFSPDTATPSHVDYDLWLGPAPKRKFNPNRFHWNWRWYWDYAGGQQADWGIHLIDIIQWFMGVNAPDSVSSSGAKRILQDNTETPDTQETIFNYPNFDLVYEHRQANARPIENRKHGMAFYGENGTLVITRGEWAVYSEGQRIAKPPKVNGGPDNNMFVKHARHFLQCVRREAKPNADIESGHRSTSTCQLANISMLVGRKIKWDAAREVVIDDPEANALLKRKYRKPWVLPEV
ncbi:MAG: Gfo/Idh/MocA family oxidoreductase, partial [Planctomycetota bacterium]